MLHEGLSFINVRLAADPDCSADKNRHGLTMTKSSILGVIAALAASACGSSVPVAQQAKAEGEPILEAVLVYQVSQFVEAEEPPVPVCLEINGDAGPMDPSADLLS